MLAVLLLDYRLAFLLLASVFLGTAIPIGLAWASLLPEDGAPFESSGDSAPNLASIYLPEGYVPRDPFAVFLLACVTLSFLLQFPGLPGEDLLRKFLPAVPAKWMDG